MFGDKLDNIFSQLEMPRFKFVQIGSHGSAAPFAPLMPFLPSKRIIQLSVSFPEFIIISVLKNEFMLARIFIFNVMGQTQNRSGRLEEAVKYFLPLDKRAFNHEKEEETQ